jgi:5-oxoprolinase (ATP-hydrolysing)
VTDTTTGETIQILRRPNPEIVSQQLDDLKSKGINSIAVAFVHSYLWGDHEKVVADMARAKGFAVSVSHELQPMVSQSC